MPKDKGSGRGYSSTPLSPRLHRAAPDHLRGPRFQVSDAASRPSRFGRLRARRPSSELETVKRQEGRKRQPWELITVAPRTPNSTKPARI